MTRLIDAQDTFNVLSDYYHHNSATQHLALQEALNKVPTVDAVPIEFIEKRIAELKKLNEYEFIANGGYTSPSDYEQWELERLIRDWREQND